MQNAEILRRQQIADHAERRRALNDALERLIQRYFGCSHRRIGRLFTREGYTYRVCLDCGIRLGLELKKWETLGICGPKDEAVIAETAVA
jgi:hypothetical protein